MFKHILVATDGSELSTKAVAAGIALAKELKAELTAVTRQRTMDGVCAGSAGAWLPQ